MKNWADCTSGEFSGLDPEHAIAILPLAAIEQHGPHLPVGTDTHIADDLLAALARALPDDNGLYRLPTQAVGVSTEHLAFPGTLTLSPQVAISAWTEIGASVARAGIRKLVLFNAHGGNSAVIDLVARELRAHHGMLAVTVHWARFGYPEELLDAEEQRFGIHAGTAETALMLQNRPDTVKAGEVALFRSLGSDMAAEARWFSTDRPAGFGWMVQDLNAAGAVGDAARATAGMGEQLMAHAVSGLTELIEEIRKFPLSRLKEGPSDSR
ncbi:creatininase [Agaricicola taiwanensis]|uniref:Creatininase n=1 Tax=Agaricicola taiwanensis TaxID=591372 RepID=A0A8J2YLY7_9RHOB|nr:creatininase family protein [Agaricicola taiwanensis]GGE53461.1 creatininase [Agaricicola taiwanensis]